MKTQAFGDFIVKKVKKLNENICFFANFDEFSYVLLRFSLGFGIPGWMCGSWSSSRLAEPLPLKSLPDPEKSKKSKKLNENNGFW